MLQFQAYLRAELGKLQVRKDAEAFIAAVAPTGLLTDLKLVSDPDCLARAMNSQAAVNELVARLSPDLLTRLSKACGNEWRDNPNLYRQLMSSNHWFEEEVEVNSILLNQAECSLGDIFRELGYRLADIAVDKRILSRPPYCHRQPGELVDYPVCLAKRQPDAYQLFDGMHRAIQLVRNGQTRIRICFADEGETM